MKVIYATDDQEKIDRMKDKILQNNGYCTCSIVKNDATICMCKDFREQTTPGVCHCGLYKEVLNG